MTHSFVCCQNRNIYPGSHKAPEKRPYRLWGQVAKSTYCRTRGDMSHSCRAQARSSHGDLFPEHPTQTPAQPYNRNLAALSRYLIHRCRTLSSPVALSVYASLVAFSLSDVGLDSHSDSSSGEVGGFDCFGSSSFCKKLSEAFSHRWIAKVKADLLYTAAMLDASRIRSSSSSWIMHSESTQTYRKPNLQQSLRASLIVSGRLYSGIDSRY